MVYSRYLLFRGGLRAKVPDPLPPPTHLKNASAIISKLLSGYEEEPSQGGEAKGLKDRASGPPSRSF